MTTCPVCLGGTRVLDTRRPHSVTCRRRECKDCEYRFNTRELPIAELEKLQRRQPGAATVQRLQRLRDDLLEDVRRMQRKISALC